MATLTIPFTFVAGTAAKAAEVNANFDAIESWSQGNIGTDNIGVLYSRSAPLPISPANAILNISQSSNNQALYISNAGTVSPIQIAQSGQLASSNAILKIDSTGLSQTVVGAAELLINSHVNTTIPTLLVNHGAVETLRLTKTALNVGSAVTTTLGGPLVLSNPAVTGPINLSGNLSVTGKETINRTSTNQFLELANTTTSKSLTVTPETASFDLNINDTTSAYQFKINGVTKTVIDNNGLDGSYLKTASVLPSAINGGVAAQNRTYSPYQITNITNTSVANVSTTATLGTTTFTTSANNKVIKIEVVPRIDDSAYLGLTSRNANNQNTLYAFLEVNGSMVALFPWRLPSGALPAISFTNPTHTSPFQPQLHAIRFCATQGIQTISLKAVVGGWMGDTTWTVSGYQFIIYELG